MPRLIRVLVYEGSAEWINHSMRNRGVKGSRTLGVDTCIREAIIGDFIEPFDTTTCSPQALTTLRSIDAEEFYPKNLEMAQGFHEGIQHAISVLTYPNKEGQNA